MSRNIQNVNVEHRGRWQAQGDDIAKKGGYSVPWGRPQPPTKQEGELDVERLKGHCEARELALRQQVFDKALRHIRRAPEDGFLGPHTKSFPVASPPKKAKRARVDLEVWEGRAFIGSPCADDVGIEA